MSIFYNISQHYRQMLELMEQNKDAITEYNKNMLLCLLIFLCLLLLIPIGASLLIKGRAGSVPFYITTAVVSIGLIICGKLGWFDKRPRIGLYIGFVMVFLQNILLSVINSPDQRATILLGTFCIMPLCFIDNIWRIACTETFFYTLHTALSLHYKGITLGIDDAINCLCFLTLGLFIGSVVQANKLNAFTLQKKLLWERETDVLTGLKNRRKMYEMFSELRQGKAELPSCAYMIDIDHFKLYNDTYGHAAGDGFLQALGAALLELEQRCHIRFFRYGGEELAAFAWGCGPAAAHRLAETIRDAVERISDPHGGRTVSIGYADCPTDANVNYESVLNCADQALYEAKDKGRNRAIRYSQA